MELNKIYNEDCLEGMKRIPDESVDFILTDPPYGTIKGLTLDRGLKRTDWDNKVELNVLFKEYFRVLKPKGKVIVFSQNQFTQEVRNMSSTYLTYNYPLIWLKNNFANYLSINKAPAQIFEDMSVFSKQYGLMPESRSYARKMLGYIGLSAGEINKKLGHRKAEHFFRVDTLQFSNITLEAYKDLMNVFKIDDMDGFLIYSDWIELYAREKKEKNAKVGFNIPDGKNSVTNVFEYPKESKRYHPTQKPIALLNDLIKLYTEDEAVILDSFMGSGSTAIACMNTNRNFIGFELDETYFNIANERIEQIK